MRNKNLEKSNGKQKYEVNQRIPQHKKCNKSNTEKANQ